MNDSQDRLREMLHRRGDRIHSSLTISNIRDAGLRTHRHPMRLVGPVLVAASVVVVVVVVALAGRPGAPSVPPAGPGPGISVTTPHVQTAPRTDGPSVTGAVTTSAAPAPSEMRATNLTSGAAATTTVRASP